MPDDVISALPPEAFNQLAVCRHGLMLYNRHDRYIGPSLRKYGEFSPGELEAFRMVLRPGMTVVEVGANIGAHTVELARLVAPGPVLAFEPQRLVFQTLCANVAINSCANVYAFQVAMGAAPGGILVPELDPNLPANFGGVSLGGAAPGATRVQLSTIDSLGLPACHFIKADVEGMEADVLRGAQATIRRHRPVIYVENDRAERSPALIALLQRDLGYRLYWHAVPMFVPDNFRGDAENIFGTDVSGNMLCLPAEAPQDIAGLRECTGPEDTW